ncbi:alpha/beta hydrolase, partial [Mycobacterium sp. NAZ190054]|uniref:alpha/beta hydrolase n=1 Tax=Mycobacterium sp. NAZ190054 TaxID=1747766 RepID=UPI001E427893
MTETVTGPLPGRSEQPPARRKVSTGDVLANKIAGVTLRAMPHIPDPVKRILLGGRSITVDGNTLDTTMQLMLAGQHLLGLDGLVADDDHVAARAQLELLAGSFPKRTPVAAVTDLTVTGAEGPRTARHYRTDEAAAPLLVFFHGGGHVIGSIASHDDLCREICRTGGFHVLSVDYRLAPEHPAPVTVRSVTAATGVRLGQGPDGECGGDGGTCGGLGGR